MESEKEEKDSIYFQLNLFSSAKLSLAQTLANCLSVDLHLGSISPNFFAEQKHAKVWRLAKILPFHFTKKVTNVSNFTRAHQKRRRILRTNVGEIDS
jgi:hypothetical protein